VLDQNVTLLFGIGAQKAGTTWLHNYLTLHPDCVCPDVKEVTYFSQLYLAAYQNRRSEMARKYRSRRLALPFSFGELHQKNRRKLNYYRFISDKNLGRDPSHSRYLEFLTKNWNGQSVISDITPSYALLGRDRIAEMASVAPRTRFVYSMRDPVDRLWSMLRMRARNQTRFGGNFMKTALHALDHILDGGKSMFPPDSDYRSTVSRLDAAVPEKHRLYLFSETIFQSGNISELTDLLGIQPIAADAATRVHSGRPAMLDDGRLMRAGRYLSEQYQFAFDRFGDKVPDLWHQRYDWFSQAGAGPAAQPQIRFGT